MDDKYWITNPSTGRPIKKGGHTYMILVRSGQIKEEDIDEKYEKDMEEKLSSSESEYESEYESSSESEYESESNNNNNDNDKKNNMVGNLKNIDLDNMDDEQVDKLYAMLSSLNKK
jgi:hypothetical protein